MNAVKHFLTITKHRWMVRKHCFRVGLYWQGLTHDLSKYTWQEFRSGILYYQGTRSPNSRERELNGYSLAWMHHKGRNKHHFEYWSDVSPVTKCYEPVPMPLRYITEMFCDRVAACKIYRGKDYNDSAALEYYSRGNARAKMHPSTADQLEEWLRMLAEKGEKETFAYIKKVNKEAKKK